MAGDLGALLAQVEDHVQAREQELTRQRDRLRQQLEDARRGCEVALDAAAGAHDELGRTTARQQAVVDRLQREVDEQRAGADRLQAWGDGLHAELTDVRQHLEHVLDQLRTERDEHAELLRSHARVLRDRDLLAEQHAACTEGVLVELPDDGDTVLVRLNQPGRMVTISSVPYTEDEQPEHVCSTGCSTGGCPG